jgi:iron complex transport system permease protein
MSGQGNRHRTFFIVLGSLTLAVLVITPFIGLHSIPLNAVFQPAEAGTAGDIFWGIRVPRTLTAFMAGAALAISGMAFQAMFRNPLATPFTLGVSSGASFGAAMFMRLGLAFSVLGISGVSFFAFLGALLSVVLVYSLTRARKGFSTASMLLAGVAISLFFSALILFLQYLSDFANSFRILRWLMGGLEIAGFDTVLNLLPFVAAGAAILFYLTHELNLMLTGDELAASRGVDVKRSRNTVFIATSLMVGSVVAVCGPIGFVGMMVPHISRLMVGANHRVLLPATFLFGGAFLTLCDTLARLLIAPAEIPVGIITAMLGGPFFIWLLLGGTLARGGFVESR